jgi:hypothetical protein
MVEPVEKQQFGERRGQVAILPVAIGHDHGRRIGSGQKIGQPDIRIARIQINGGLDVTRGEIGGVARIGKNSPLFLVQAPRIRDGNFGEPLFDERLSGDILVN